MGKIFVYQITNTWVRPAIKKCNHCVNMNRRWKSSEIKMRNLRSNCSESPGPRPLVHKSFRFRCLLLTQSEHSSYEWITLKTVTDACVGCARCVYVFDSQTAFFWCGAESTHVFIFFATLMTSLQWLFLATSRPSQQILSIQRRTSSGQRLRPTFRWWWTTQLFEPASSSARRFGRATYFRRRWSHCFS